MNKTISRIAAGTLAAVMTLSLSSCGKKGDVIASKEHVYSIEKIKFEHDLDYVNNIMYSDGKIYLVGDRSWQENPDGTPYVPKPIEDGGESDDTAVAVPIIGGGTAVAYNVDVIDEPALDVEAAGDVSVVDDASAEADGFTSDAADIVLGPGAVETMIAVTEVSVADEAVDEDIAVDVTVDGDEPAPVEEPVEEIIYCQETKMLILNLDGTKESEVVLSSSKDSNTAQEGSTTSKWIQSIQPDKDGGVIAIENVYTYTFDTGESKNSYNLTKYGADGSTVFTANLDKLAEGSENFYVNDLLPIGNEQYIVSSDGTIFLIDSQGNIVSEIKNETASKDSWTSGLYESGDGRFFTTVSESKMVGDEYKYTQNLIEIDIANKKFGASYDITNVNGSLINGTDKYDLLCTRDSGLVGLDIETGETEMIIDWLKSGMDTATMNTDTTTVLPDGRILCITYEYELNGGGGYSWSNDNMIISMLTEIPPEEIPDKKLIKLYALWLDIDVKRQILEFNKNSLEYEIELTSYSDYEDSVTRLNNDMIAGNLPDILIIDTYNMPVDSYISKGLLADLYEFMDNDESINRGDYLENFLKAYEVDGKLYELAPSFQINTITGKTSLVGESQGWTMDEFIATVDAHPEMEVFGENNTKENVLAMFINSCYGRYINRETGECSFNSDEFVKLLEFCNRFPEKEDENYWENVDWQERENQYRANKTLLSTSYISRFGDLRQYEMGSFGEPVTFKGYPGIEGSGSAFSSGGTSVAITAKANNKEGAWDFVKYFLSDDYQNQYTTQNSYTFPIKLSALEAQAEAFKERPYWTDQDGNKEYYDNTYYMGGQEIKIGVNTDEDNRRMMDFIKSVDNVFRYDTDISKIINEEVPAYFSGQKTAQDVANTIQNRVSNYVAENR